MGTHRRHCHRTLPAYTNKNHAGGERYLVLGWISCGVGRGHCNCVHEMLHLQVFIPAGGGHACQRLTARPSGAVASGCVHVRVCVQASRGAGDAKGAEDGGWEKCSQPLPAEDIVAVGDGKRKPFLLHTPRQVRQGPGGRGRGDT